MMEKAIEKTYNLFVDLIANRQEKPIDLYLFKDEINQIKELYPDVTQLFESEAFGKVSVRKGMLNSKYRFFIDSGTTMKKDEMAENESLQNILLMISKIPQLMPFVNPGELFKRILITSGASDWDKIINEAAIEQEGQVVPGQAVMAQGGQPQVMPQGMPPQVPGQQVAPQIPPIQSQDPAVLDLAQKIAQAAQSGNSNTNI
jgi:alkylhydroperoxidase/carboxymuconolactone decarboxylase family protein YurZ